MKIAYLSCDFGVEVGGSTGASVHVRELVRALRQLGHEVRIFSAAAEGVEDTMAHHLPLSDAAATVIELARSEQPALPAHLFRELRRVLYADFARRALLPMLGHFRPDALYERYALFSDAGVSLAREVSAPLLLEVNAPLAEEASTHRELYLRTVADDVERRVVSSADAVLAVSEAVREHALELGAPTDRITVLPNAVDADRFSPEVSGAEVRRRYGLDGKRVVGYAGSLKRWHDLDALTGAVEALAREDGRFHLLAVGEGPRLEELRAMGASYLTCPGAVPHEEVPEHLAAMDAVVAPFTAEGGAYFSPLKLFEAMAMAKPVVASATGQMGEVVRDAETGLLYTPGDAQELASKLRDVFERADGGASLGAAARAAVLGGRTWRHNAARVVAIAEALRGVTPVVL